MTLPVYEIDAVRYAHRGGRYAGHFLHGDPHAAPMLMDYFVRRVRDERRIVAVDTGSSEAVAKRRGREFLRSARACTTGLLTALPASGPIASTPKPPMPRPAGRAKPARNGCRSGCR